MPVRDLAQRIVDAMTSAPGDATLQNQKPHDPEAETLLGTLPRHLCPLAALLEQSNTAANTAHDAWSITPDDSPEDAAAKAVYRAADEERQLLHGLFWRSVEQYIEHDREIYSTLRLTSDWEIVGVRKTDLDRALEKLRERLLGCMMQ